MSIKNLFLTSFGNMNFNKQPFISKVHIFTYMALLSSITLILVGLYVTFPSFKTESLIEIYVALVSKVLFDSQNRFNRLLLNIIHSRAVTESCSEPCYIKMLLCLNHHNVKEQKINIVNSLTKRCYNAVVEWML